MSDSERLKRTAKNSPQNARFYASAVKDMKTVLFRVIIQRVMVIYYRRFGTECLEKSVMNHHRTLRNSQEEQSSHLPSTAEASVRIVISCGQSGRVKHYIEIPVFMTGGVAFLSSFQQTQATPT
jgi:hypothetical protein